MKKLLQTLSAALVSVGLMAGVAAADSISNTGPGSNNTINNTTTNTSIITNNNNLSCSSSNTQSASTGTANVSGNTTGGSASSGSSSNSNSSSCNLSVNSASATVASAPAPVGGRGGETLAAQAAHNSVKVAALPETGSNAIQTVAMFVAAGLFALMAATRTGLKAYRHIALK